MPELTQAGKFLSGQAFIVYDQRSHWYFRLGMINVAVTVPDPGVMVSEALSP